MQAITIGADAFPFRAHEVSLQDVVRIPAQDGSPSREVAQISHRIHVQVASAPHLMTPY